MFKEKINYFDLVIQWKKTNSAEYPYETVTKGHHLKVRVNDFPENMLYSLLIDDEVVKDFNNWPDKWKK